MDFKVTGTREGICGVQMDIKVDGLSMNTMREALEQARKGRCISSMRCMRPCRRPVRK
jgi:polyribonucleotide nucleotidyltransferase